jgi:hypothetical protein
VHQALPLQVLSQPHESGAEHSIGGSKKVELQRFDRGARVDDVLGELVGNLSSGG